MEHCKNCNGEYEPEPDAEFWFCETCDTKNMCRGSRINHRHGNPTEPHTTPSEHNVERY